MIVAEIERAFLVRGYGPPRCAVVTFLFCAAINLNAVIGLFWRLARQLAYLTNNAVLDF